MTGTDASPGVHGSERRLLRVKVPRPLHLGIWLGLLGLLALTGARRVPHLVESAYSGGVYPALAGAVASVTGVIPFSVGDTGQVLALPAAVAVGRRAWKRARDAGGLRRRAAVSVLAAVLALMGWIWACALPLYALNYARPAPEVLFGLGGRDIPPQRIDEIVAMIGSRTGRLRAQLPEDGKGIVRMPKDLRPLDRHLAQAQARALNRAGVAAVTTGRTKTSGAGVVLQRWGISGLYSPLTAEPTVVRPEPPGLLPSIAAHERAHLAGFAAEDDASFVGILTAWVSQRPEVRYSGWLDLWLEFGRDSSSLHPGVLRDHVAISAHYRRTVKREAVAHRAVYDTYLKGIGEPLGIDSYDRVAALAILYIDRHGMPPDPLDPAAGPTGPEQP
ncbi:MAG TPA: DUF3810 family protein [Actinomycetota bacterium]|nr:DUF3810 family protein [Actinomycetota bacterium]